MMNQSQKKKILIVQGYIPHYRISVFNRLASVEYLDVTVLHSGAPTASECTFYKEIIVEETRVGPARFQRRLREISFQFDAIIAEFDMKWISTLLFLFSASDQKIIFWGKGFGRKAWVNRLRLGVLKKAHALLLYDDNAVPAFIRNGYPEERIFVANNTVEGGGDINWDAPREHFLFVGRLQMRKRIEDLLEAFSRAHSDIPAKTRVLIVGAGALRETLEALTNELGISRKVSFLGKITDERELSPVFSQSLAYVSPGDVGLGVLHSFAHGVPVVTKRKANHGPEVNNIIDGVNGFFYDGTIAELGRRLTYLANHPDEAKQLGKNAYLHYAEHRTIDKMVSGFTDAISYVLPP